MFKTPDLPTLAQVGDFGQPYHGLAKQTGGSNASVDLPNSTTKSLGRTLASGNTRLTQRPGWSAVSRTGAAAARDTANGWSWPNWFIFGGVFALPDSYWVFVDNGVPWLVYPSKSSGAWKLYFCRFGVFGQAPSWSSISITGTLPASGISLGAWQNHTPSGDKACWLMLTDAARGIYEITLTGNSGAGPSAAACGYTDPLIADDYTVTSADADYTLCDSDVTVGSTWFDDTALYENECVVKVDYVSGTMVQWILRQRHEMIASASFSNTPDSGAGDCLLARDEDVDWTYEAWIRQDSGTETQILDAAITRHTERRYDMAANTDSLDTSDSVSVNGPTWTGTYHVAHSNLNLNGSGSYLIDIHGPRPTLRDGFGLGAWTSDWDMTPPASETASGNYPYYWLGSGLPLDIVTLNAPVTAYRSALGGMAWNNVLLDDDYGIFEIEIKDQTNNVMTVKVSLADTPLTLSSTVTTSWGPSIATETSSATVMTGATHWASYHPVDKTLSRSTTQQLAWF